MSASPDSPVVVVPSDGTRGCALCGGHRDGHHAVLDRPVCERCAEWVDLPAPSATSDTVFVEGVPWAVDDVLECGCGRDLPARVVGLLVSKGFEVACDGCGREHVAVTGRGREGTA